MSMEELQERGAALVAELDAIRDRYGEDPALMPLGQRQRAENLTRALHNVSVDMKAAEELERRRERGREIIERVRAGDPAFELEPGFEGVPSRRRSDPWRGLDRPLTESADGYRSRAHDVLGLVGGLSDPARARLADAVDSPRGGGVAAQFVVARSNPAYLSGFAKLLRAPDRAFTAFTPEESDAFAQVERIRAALTTDVGTGGYLIPLALDPNLAAITSSGVANPFRAHATVKTTISSPHRAVVSAGITPAWVAEGAAFGDNTPTFSNKDVDLFKLGAFVSASFEVLEDSGSAITGALPVLLADARDTAESAAFATGNGTSAPRGIVTAISATVASTITATTRGSFTSASAADTIGLLDAVTPRARQSGRAAAFANRVHITTVRQQTVGTTGVPVVGMGDAVPAPLGIPMYEASSMASVTTSGTVLVVAGDMSKYLIVDHAAGPALEYVPILLDQSTARPNGTRGWVYHQRTGADVLDVNAFRFLKA